MLNFVCFLNKSFDETRFLERCVMWAFLANLLLSIIQTIFDEQIKSFFWGLIGVITAVIVGATSIFGDGIGSVFDGGDGISKRIIHSDKVKDYLMVQDSADVGLSYNPRKQYKNEYGVGLDHDNDTDIDWYMGRSCDVRSGRTGVSGEWAVGEHVWVVVFGRDRAVFTRESLPSKIDQETIERCTIKH